MFIPFHPEKSMVCCACKKTGDCIWNTHIKAYICSNCSSKKDYGEKNEIVKGTKQKRLPMFSCEFEIQEPPSDTDEAQPMQIEAAQQLLRYQYLRTADASVNEEYKSPRYQSLKAFYPALEVMDKLRHLVGPDCGTHIHVECHVKDLLIQCFGEVFAPITNRLITHPVETLAFWGRGFNEYAEPYPRGRSGVFNLQTGQETLEYRLPRFRSKEQYSSVVQFARTCTALLNKKMPLVQEKPHRLANIAQQILCLYESHLPGEIQPGWLDNLTKEQKQECMNSVWQTTM